MKMDGILYFSEMCIYPKTATTICMQMDHLWLTLSILHLQWNLISNIFIKSRFCFSSYIPVLLLLVSFFPFQLNCSWFLILICILKNLKDNIYGLYLCGAQSVSWSYQVKGCWFQSHQGSKYKWRVRIWISFRSLIHYLFLKAESQYVSISN